MGWNRGTLTAVALAIAVIRPGAAADIRFITIDAAPWASLDGNGRPQGVFPALAAELERRTGHRLEIAIRPFPRIDRDLESGDQDCTVILWNDKRGRIVEKGEDVHPMSFGVIGRRGLRMAGYDSLRGLTVSVTRNLAIDPHFDADASLKKEIDKDYRTGLEKMARGRVDAIAGAIPTIRYIARQAGLGDVAGEALQLTTIPLALQCARSSRHLGLMGELDAAIRAMRADGTLPRIMAEHYGD